MLKVGLIVDEGQLPYLAHNLITRSGEAEHYKIECLLIQQINQAQGSNTIEKISRIIKRRGVLATLRLLFFLVIEKIEKRVVCTKSIYKQAFTSVGSESFTIDTLECMPQVSDSGLVYRYTHSDLKSVEARGLDLLVRCGSGILRGDILNVCRLGIVSIHHGDNTRYRGGPPGFWEVFHRSPDSGFIIQILTDELDGGNVLLRGSIPTSSIATLNYARLLIKANVFLHQQLDKIGKNKKLPAPLPAMPYCHRLYSVPGFFVLFSYIGKTTSHFTRRFINKILGRGLQWGVSYQFIEDWRNTVFWKAIDIKNPPGRFFADPSVISQNGQHICFVEDFNYSDEKAKITAIAIEPDGYKILGTALEENFHLSYPFIFRHDGELYMCPETRSINEIRLYRCVEFPLQWRLHKVLLSNVAAVDTNIIEHDGHWWLFTNQDSAGLEDFGSELHLYHADSLNSEQWVAHPDNPVILDSLAGRNGGILDLGESHNRVSQAQGFDLYGESVTVHRQIELSTTAYREVDLAPINANFTTSIKGVHTFQYRDGIAAFDRVSLEKLNQT